MDWSWEATVPGGLLYLLDCAIRHYFIAVHKKQQKIGLRFSLSSTLILVAASDASATLYATLHFLVQIDQVGESRSQCVHLLESHTYLAKKTVLSIPHLEAIALVRSAQKTVELKKILDQSGFCVDPRNIIHLSDSQTIVHMSSSPPHLLESKFAHLMSKLSLHMLELGTSVQDSVYFFFRPTSSAILENYSVQMSCPRLNQPGHRMILWRGWERTLPRVSNGSTRVQTPGSIYTSCPIRRG